MRDRSEVWCETEQISIDEIDRRARLAYESNGVAAVVFISSDLYSELTKLMTPTTRLSVGSTYGPSPNVLIRIMCSTGELHFQKVSQYRNFLLVGVKADLDAFIQAGVDPVFWNDQERARVDKEFEKEILLEDKDET